MPNQPKITQHQMLPWLKIHLPASMLMNTARKIT